MSAKNCGIVNTLVCYWLFMLIFTFANVVFGKWLYYCQCWCVGTGTMKRNRMCDTIRFVCLLLLNLEWHYVMSADTVRSTELTDTTSPTETFASLLHSEVYTKSSRDSEGLSSRFYEQSDTFKSERSTAATEEAHMSASDFSRHFVHTPSTHVTVSEVSSTVSKSPNPSTTKVTPHSVSDRTQFLSSEQVIKSTSTQMPPTMVLEISFGDSNNDTTPCPSTQATYDSFHGNHSVEETDMSFSHDSIHGTSTTIAVLSTNVSSYRTSYQMTELSSSGNSASSHVLVQLTSNSVTDSVTHTTPHLTTEHTAISATEVSDYSTPCLSTDVTEIIHFSDVSAATPEISMLVTSSSVTYSSTDTTPCLSTKQSDFTTYSEQYLTTYDDVMTVSVTDRNVDTTVSSTENNTDSVPAQYTEQTNISNSSPFSFSDIIESSSGVTTAETTACPSTQTIPLVVTDTSRPTPFLLTEHKSMSTISRRPSTYRTETSSTVTDSDATLSPSTQVRISSADVNNSNTASYLSLELTNTPYTSTYGTETFSTSTTLSVSTQVTTSSANIGDNDTTSCPLTEQTTMTTSTPCLSTDAVDDTHTSSNVRTTPWPSTETRSAVVRTSNTEPFLSIEEMSISASTPCPSTSAETSSAVSDSVTTPCLSTQETSISASTPCLSTSLAEMSFPVSDSDATPCPSWPSVGMTDYSSDISSHTTASVSKQVTSDTSTSSLFVESKDISTLSVQYSESPDSSSNPSNVATSTAMYSMHSSTDDLDFTSPCCSTEFPSYSVETTAHSSDTRGLLSSTPEVPVTVNIDTSELLSAEYSLLSSTTVDVSSAGTTLANSIVSSTFFDDDTTQLGITTEVPFTVSNYVSKLLTTTGDSLSVSVTETAVDTFATVKLSYSTDGVTTTSDVYAQLTSSEGLLFSVPVDFSESSHAGYDSVPFTVSPFVSTSSEKVSNYSTGTEALVSMHSADTVETEPELSTDTTAAIVSGGDLVYATSEAAISSSVVSTTVTTSVDIAFSSMTQTDVSVTSLDEKNTSASTASTVVDSLPGDFRVQC